MSGLFDEDGAAEQDDVQDLATWLTELEKQAARRYKEQTAAKDSKPTWGQHVGAFVSSLFIVELWRAIKEKALRALNNDDPLAFTSEATLSREIVDKQLQLAKRSQRLRLRRTVAKWAIFFVAVQLISSNYFFWRYLQGTDFVVAPPVMIAWLSACVIEVIGILIVITQSLFPKRDKKGSDDSENGY